MKTKVMGEKKSKFQKIMLTQLIQDRKVFELNLNCFINGHKADLLDPDPPNLITCFFNQSSKSLR